MRQHSSEEKAHFFEKITNLSLHGRSIRNIRNLNMCTRLRVLFLYSNRIERIENLSFARNLTHLYLENNQISRIEDLTNLTQLTKLSLDGNRISKLEGLENCCSLLELHLSNQRLELGESLEFDPQSIAGLAGSLQLLTIANAQVESILPLAGLAQLQVLRASHNKILSSDLAQAEAVLKGCTLLEEVDFAETPLAGAPDYRDTLIAKSEYIALIDCKPVQPNQRQFLQARARRRALGRASTSRLRASGANVAKGSTPSLSMDVVGSSTVDSGATRSSNQESQASLGSMLSQATYVTDATAFSHAAVPSRRHPLPMFHSSSATSKRAPHVPESEIEASFAGFLHTKPVSLSATK